MRFKGYGDTKPLVPNNTAENRARNRRTEFTLTTR
jgi:flagellar motor protein MotB